MAALTYQKLVAKQFSPDFQSAIAVETVPMPVPQAGEILIRNKFAGVNAGFDTLLCQGKLPYVHLELPCDLGVEAVGEVVAIGPGVTDWQVGDAVATMGRGGGYREYQQIPAAVGVKIPAAMPELLTLMPTGISALVALEQAGEMGTGETVLVTAAAGGTGHIAVQLAKLAGNHVIGTCGSAAKAQLLQELGCDRVINYRQEDLQTVLQQEYPQGLNVVFDCVGGQVFDCCLEHLAVRGRLVIVGFISEYANNPERVTQPRIHQHLFWKAASVRAFLMPHYAKHMAAARDRLLALFQSGQLRVVIHPTPFRGIASIPAAVNALLAGQTIGKVVVQLDDSLPLE